MTKAAAYEVLDDVVVGSSSTATGEWVERKFTKGRHAPKSEDEQRLLDQLVSIGQANPPTAEEAE